MRPKVVHKLVAQDTIEERILELQFRKRELAETAIGQGTVSASRSHAQSCLP